MRQRAAFPDALVLGTPVVVVLALIVGAGAAPSNLVPSARGGFPRWLAGPLDGVAWPLPSIAWGALLLVLLVAYALAVSRAERLGLRAVVGAVVVAHVLLLVGPPLLSGDVFSYIGYARLGVLHELSPYTHGAEELGPDRVHPFVLWRDARSPYGPSFTLLTYALVPLGIAGSLWVLKTVAVLASLGCVALVASVAKSPARAAAFVGLNPVVLAFAVGGAHNDLLVAVLLAGAAACLAGRRGVPAAALAVAAGTVKLSALLVVPFAVAADPRRRRAALAAAAALAIALVTAVVAFGASATGMVAAIGRQQVILANHSVPGVLTHAVGGHALPGIVRVALSLGFAAVVVITLRRAWRGGDPAGAAGWATLALLLTTTWLLPWYLVWLLPLVALSADRRLETAAMLMTAYIVISRLPWAG
jgi:alpha-1,6-mannosyltransferase